MALTQTQIIQSLGEALSWFERELSWGVPPQELNHLTGRIGELYAAMITRGQMALEVNQHGYDVISADNERISVKTITTSSHVSFNKNTMADVDRIIVLRLNVDDDMGVSVEEILDEPKGAAIKLMTETPSVFRLSSSLSKRTHKPISDLRVLDEAIYKDFLIRRYESQTIQVLQSGEVQAPAKPHLREIAKVIGVALYYDQDKPKNTRQLGRHIIDVLNSDSFTR